MLWWRLFAGKNGLTFFGKGARSFPCVLRRKDRLTDFEFAFERFYRKTALMGTPETCTPMVSELAEAGVDEIACLIDFGAPEEAILEGLESLDRLRQGPSA